MANLRRKETINRLCALVTKVGENHFNNELPHDCFCYPKDSQVDEKIIEFIEKAVNALSSDLDRFFELYKSVGIELIPEETATSYKLRIDYGAPKVDGYPGSVTEIIFDKNGKFLCQEVFEE